MSNQTPKRSLGFMDHERVQLTRFIEDLSGEVPSGATSDFQLIVDFARSMTKTANRLANMQANLMKIIQQTKDDQQKMLEDQRTLLNIVEVLRKAVTH